MKDNGTCSKFKIYIYIYIYIYICAENVCYLNVRTENNKMVIPASELGQDS